MRSLRSPALPAGADWLIPPLAVLATMATVIASQALITGAYSFTAQAIKLDFLPRLAVRHTSPQHIGQIYVPLVNWALMIACVGLVLGFRTSSSLAGAYGIAIVVTMGITTTLFHRVARRQLGWSALKAGLILYPVSGDRPRLSRREHPEDPGRRLVAAAGRADSREPDDHVAQGTRSRRRPDAASRNAAGRPRRGADSAARFFDLPADRVVTVGTRVEI